MYQRELLEKTCQIANMLKKAGVTKGDKVMIYMPAMPLAVAAMLACARTGAVHWYIGSIVVMTWVSVILDPGLDCGLDLTEDSCI